MAILLNLVKSVGGYYVGHLKINFSTGTLLSYDGVVACQIYRNVSHYLILSQGKHFDKFNTDNGISLFSEPSVHILKICAPTG